MKRSPLPTVVGEAFLAGDGFIGLRCECGYLVTGRTAFAVDAGIREHHAAVHLQSTDQRPHTEFTE